MSRPTGARVRRFASIAIAAVVLGMMLAWALPAAADEIVIDTEQTVQQGQCEYCHANISDTDNYSKEIIFTHGLHIMIACESCHSKFPHSRSGTAVPTMKQCFACHGLQHGPMGTLATGKCEDCHITPRERLRPAFHTSDWEYKPHVEPGNKELQTQCMMCHTAQQCDDCHAQQGIDWKPEKAYRYDPRDGCVACHGNENLVKAAADGPKSFQVTGVDQSAHRNVSCIECHQDFKYEAGEDPTNLWDVNVGLACQGCHDHEKVAKDYATSIHGQELAKGNMKTATCASCHGGHNIQKLNTEAARNDLQLSAYKVCARCHKKWYDSFDDYYHGRPYKEGNLDAPACWNCHGDHKLLGSSDPKSSVNPKNLEASCGGSEAPGMACHRGSGEAFGRDAGDLIHKKREVREGNALAKLITNVKGWFGGGE